MPHKRTNRDRLRCFGEYVAAVLRYLSERPKSLPTLETFRASDDESKQFGELLAFERRRVRKAQNLLDKLTEAFENRQYNKVDAISVEIDGLLTELFYIRWELWNRFHRIK